jgi:hypothetical protein
LVKLLEASDAKASTTRGLSEFVELTGGFDNESLKAFVKLAEVGRNPPTAVPKTKGKTKVGDPEAIAAEVKDLYERAAEPAVTEERMREACDKLGGLSKDGLVRLADAIGLFGMKSKKKDGIVLEITNRLLDRKGAVIRKELINRPQSGGAPTEPAAR